MIIVMTMIMMMMVIVLVVLVVVVVVVVLLLLLVVLMLSLMASVSEGDPCMGFSLSSLLSSVPFLLFFSFLLSSLFHCALCTVIRTAF